MTEDISAQITQLQQQQAILTQALKAALEGTWTGAGSVEALLYALDPALQGNVDPDPPVLSSDYEANATGPPIGFHFDPYHHMPRQVNNWSCSACALAWLLRATDKAPECNENCGINLIGLPVHINATYGLMDGSGAQLQRVLDDHELMSDQGWLTFDDVYAIARDTPALMSGGAWYHWVGIRGISGSDLWIANSATGYMGVYETLSRAQFNALGPFSVVWLVS